MLSELRIENLLLISNARIEFNSGFNAFTGETGAGKSLMLDAIEFLLGARGDASMIRAGAEQAEVSACFILKDKDLVAAFTRDLGLVFEDDGSGFSELVLSRTIPKTGRSRAYANGRPIALPALKELGERLLDIHGQNENQSLLRAPARLDILDRFSEAESEREAVKQAHRAAMDAAKRLASLRRAARDRQGRQDLARFQLHELEDARLDDFDPAELEGELKLLRGAEKIREAALATCALLDGEDGDGAAQFLSRALKALGAAGDAGPDAAELCERIESMLDDVRDASHDANSLADKARSDPERLGELEDVFAKWKTLQRKHGRTFAELTAFRDILRAELSGLDQLESNTEAGEKALTAAIETLKTTCGALSRKRKFGARQLEKKVNTELRGMGLNHATLGIELSSNEIAATPATPEKKDAFTTPLSDEDDDPSAEALIPAHLKSSGAEGAEIMFTANPDLPPKPLRESASGGEIARVMLALKGVLARAGGADRLPVVVFDEVDSGVGGRLGAMLGKKLRDLATVRQVICVTHQPQLAVCAQSQFKVSKSQSGKTTTVVVSLLQGDARIDEIALMLRGSEASSHTREEAAAMLKAAE
ncbi:MAG: DNA repair protein RecN [Planctomycetota bacterium]